MPQGEVVEPAQAQMTAELRTLQFQGYESMKRVLSWRFGGQVNRVRQSTFPEGRDDLSSPRRARMVEWLHEENPQFKTWGDVSRRRAMGMVFGGPLALLAKLSLAG